MVTKYYPELVTESLASLAAPLSEKRYRKQILTEIVCERYKRDIFLPDLLDPKLQEIVPFGTNLAKDFLALYIIKHRGVEWAEKTLSDIPQDAIRLAKCLKLDFYERLNPRFLVTIPENLKPYYTKRLKLAGIYLYEAVDWDEFKQVQQFLGVFHPRILE